MRTRIQEWKQDHQIISWMAFITAAFLLLAGLLSYLFLWFRLLVISHALPPLAPSILLLVPLVGLAFAVSLFRPRSESMSHGSAHWATLRELEAAQLVRGRNDQRQAALKKLLPAPGGTASTASSNNHGGQGQSQQREEAPESLLLVGYRGRHAIELTERQQESHVLIVAPTGKRKSSGLFIPALLGERGHRSLFINDLKGELFRLTAGAVSLSHQVLLFAPTNPDASCGYNPLAHIQTSKQARDFAAAWVANTGLSREEFYNSASRVLITALVLHLIDTEPGAPLSRLADLLSTNTLDTMKTLLLASRSARARNTAGVFLETLEANQKVASGIMLGVSNRFSILVDSQEYRQVTNHNDLDFARMIDGQRPTAFYLSVPASAVEDLKPLTSILVMQLMNFLAHRAEQEPNGRLPRPFALYLDEFANMGRVPNIEKHITLIRGAGIATIAAIQDFGQAELVYGREITITFLSNFTSQITLPGTGQNEAEYYSRRLGFSTEKSISTSATTKGGNILPTSTAKTVSEVKRALMDPDEIRTMPVGSFLMVSDNAPPVRGQLRTYIERPELLALTQLRVRRRVQVNEVKEEGRSSAALSRPTQEQKPAAGPAMTPPPETLL